MLLRRARSIVALLFAAGCLGGFALAAAADPGNAPTLQLASQSAAVVPSAPGSPVPFSLTVRVKGTSPAGAAIGLTFYERLGSRSAFEESLSATPSGIMQRVAPVPISAADATGSSIPLAVTIVAGVSEPSGSKTVGLTRCRSGDDSCSGVYPVVVELLGADGSVLSHLTTFLTYAEKRSLGPIVFSWVAPVAAPVRIHPAAPVSPAVGPLKPARVADLAQLLAILAQNPTVQVSVAASPATVEALGIVRSAKARTALIELRGFAAENPRRLLLQPYVPVNLASLSEAGITTEIQGQATRANAVMGAPSVLGGLPPPDLPTASKVWLAQGSVSSSIAEGLNEVGARYLVLPDSDLPSATEEAHATWAQPFDLPIGRGGVTAAAVDTQLSSYFTADPRDPVLAANHLLAALAMIHFELPNAPNTRGVIAVPPTAWDPNPAFVSTLVGGLASNPVVTTATLDQFFAPGAVPIGGNQAAMTRHLLPGAGLGQISPSQAAAIATARKQITGFVRAVGNSSPPVENQLEDLLLASESSELSTVAQRTTLAAFEHQLGNQLHGISVVANTVTLTARTATVPITIVSSVGYKLSATLTLSSAKLQFPQGAVRTVKIDHPTNTTDIQVRARTTGDLPLAFTLTSPGGSLLIARGRLTVRSTATSIVGIVLTLVAAIVLLGWWARTWRRGRRARATRSARSAAA